VGFTRLLEAELRDFRLRPSPLHIRLLCSYLEELDRWNRRINLTALRNSELVRRLVAVPIWIARELDMRGVIVDIGSGNGSPALPMHVTREFTAIHLVESRTRRAAFLRHVVGQLGLERVLIHQNRFQQICDEFAGAAWVTLQGVTLTTELFESIRSIPDANLNIAWITSETESPVRAASVLKVPITRTQVFLFRVDQS
jgi:16S rRNA (guanine(527)-N(7))-methyltransferase RsmG